MLISFCCYFIFTVFVSEVLGALKLPPWNWDKMTDMMFFQGCNSTGTDVAFDDDNINIISRFAIVCIEKCQGMNSNINGYHYEQYATAASKQLKTLKPNIHMMYYLNSAMDWPEFELYYKMIAIYPQYILRDINNNTVFINGAGGFNNNTNLTSFDFSQKDAAQFWASDCLNATNTQYWDSCNIDQVHCWMPGCYSKYTFSQYVYDNFNITKYQTMQYMQKTLNETNNGALYINNQFTIDDVNGFAVENLKVNEDGINELLTIASKSGVDTLSVKVHTGNCGDNQFIHPLAVYLIGVEKYMYFGCGGFKNMPASNSWHKEFNYPLGQPKGKAVKK
eukprot:354858_1